MPQIIIVSEFAKQIYICKSLFISNIHSAEQTFSIPLNYFNRVCILSPYGLISFLVTSTSILLFSTITIFCGENHIIYITIASITNLSLLSIVHTHPDRVIFKVIHLIFSIIHFLSTLLIHIVTIYERTHKYVGFSSFFYSCLC